MIRIPKPRIIRPPSIKKDYKKRALVLSGGGSKGAFQVGVLNRWIKEEGRRYDIICGISVGALNGAFLAQFEQRRQPAAVIDLEDLWLGLNNKDVWKKHFLGEAASLWKPSVYDSSPLRKLVENRLDVSKVRASGIEYRAVAVSWGTGKLYVASQGDSEIVDWVLASSSYPCFLEPVRIGGDLWSDGGVREVTPLGEAIRAGAVKIDVVMCSNPEFSSEWRTTGRNVIHYVLRTIDLMSEEIMRKDLKVCGLKNELARPGSGYANVKVELVQPSVDLVSNSLEFNPESSKRMISIGYNDSKNPTILS